MKIQIASTASEFDALRPVWQDCDRGVPTQSWEWLHAWWTVYAAAKPLRLVVCRDGDDVVGIIPFYLDRLGPLVNMRLLGSGTACSDYAGPLMLPGREKEVIQAFFEFVRTSPDREAREFREATLQLDGVFERDAWIETWNSSAESDHYRLRRRELESAWRLSLPSKLEDVAPVVHKHIRRKFKKALSRIKSGEVSVRTCTEPDLPTALDTLEKLHTLRQRRKGNPGCFADPRFGRFIRLAVTRLAAQSRIQLVECLSNEHVFASKLQLIGAGGVWMYQCGSDPDFERLEPGHLLITASLGCSIEKGYQFFDFMRGNEPYKAQWGAEDQPLNRLTYVPNRIVPLIADSTVQWLRDVKQWSKSRRAVGNATATVEEESVAETAQ